MCGSTRIRLLIVTQHDDSANYCRTIATTRIRRKPDQMHTAMWIIPILPFILVVAKTWKIKEAITQTVWFNVAYAATLAVIYLADVTGNGFMSTSPVGKGGFVAMLAGFAAMGVRTIRYRQEQKRIAEARAAAEAARRARIAAGEVAEPRSLIVDAFRVAGQMQRARKNAKR